MTDKLTAFDLGVTTNPPRAPGMADVGQLLHGVQPLNPTRPHPSPAMERALQRIEDETPATIRRVLGERRRPPGNTAAMIITAGRDWVP